ncbi:MAG: bifunctional riboflavin kinase/FAD synthetase [Syntrophomonadaceae bacterium]|nr:bifunctional riboflavin kinase/FAD synthetase [Syntrophomonadaceae bacterium]MDD3888653.1 bifunctional riboflavin kinase/FAD synthetase [Syntrophomonadaceae bacterium]
MEIVKEINNFKPSNRPLYLALGNFDGVHKGHKKIITELVEKAKKNGAIAAALIFDPHPAKVLNPDKAPKLLVNSERKAELLKELGLDILIYHTFNKDISKCSPEDFVKKILLDNLKVKEVFVGFNYSFGYKGAGNPALLEELGDKFNYKVNIIPPVKVNGEIASSSLVRQALDAGEVEKAFSMLGYYPMLEGIVIEGEHRGATIGFPTANLGVNPDFNIPAKGVYAAKAQLEDEFFNCVVNIGTKPTFHKDYPISIESHFLNFNRDIYSKSVKLYFIQKLRNQKRFESIEELTDQIKLDCAMAEKIISTMV